ncbi:MAG: hypothetical protein ACTHL8_17540 [Burkholderiaceae bacterium]
MEIWKLLPRWSAPLPGHPDAGWRRPLHAGVVGAKVVLDALSAYGALACIPAFLLWVFVAWCCVLFGVQVAAKAQPVCAGRHREG